MEPISLNRIKWQKTLKKRLFAIAAVIIAIILAAGSVYKVDTGQAVVITRFGRVAKVEQNAGINLKLPLIDKANRVSLEKRYQIEYGFRTVVPATTYESAVYNDIAEEQTVIVEAVGNNSSLVLTELTVEYQVSDPVNYLYKVDDLEHTIRLVLEDTLRNVLQSVTLNQALTDKLSIDSQIKPELQRRLNKFESGIRIIEVKTQNTSLPESVDIAYREIEKANQYRNSRIEEAQKYYNTVVPQAEGEAAQLVEDAKAYKATTIADARAEVAQFMALYNEYIKNPSIVRERIYTESMREFILNNNIVIDTTSGDDLYKFYNMEDKNNSNAHRTQAVIEGEGETADEEQS